MQIPAHRHVDQSPPIPHVPTSYMVEIKTSYIVHGRDQNNPSDGFLISGPKLRPTVKVHEERIGTIQQAHESRQ